MTTMEDTRTQAERDAEELAGRLFMANLGLVDAVTVALGDRLGLYAAVRRLGTPTAAEVAGETGLDERQVREWLEQQAVTGILGADEAPDSGARRYSLSDGHAEVLLNPDSLASMTGLCRIGAMLAAGMPLVERSFRDGRGVKYPEYGLDGVTGQESMNRVQYINLLGAEWLPSISPVHERLASGSARVADLGCGTGWTSITIAKAYPGVIVDGFDNDATSIEIARANAEREGVAGRAHFRWQDAGGSIEGTYDLVTIFESLHDMGRPVEALRNARSLAGDEGYVLVMDERVEDEFTAPASELERFYYGASVLFCLPTCLADAEESAATGTIMRTSMLRDYARQAGFAGVEVLPIEHDGWRFYHLAG